jgi:hypothetical protein
MAAAAVRDGTGRRRKQEVEMEAAAGVVNEVVAYLRPRILAASPLLMGSSKPLSDP